MKRILTFFLALTMVLSLAACGGKADDNKGNRGDHDCTRDYGHVERKAG